MFTPYNLLHCVFYGCRPNLLVVFIARCYAERDIAIVCRLSIRLSVCNVAGLL